MSRQRQQAAVLAGAAILAGLVLLAGSLRGPSGTSGVASLLPAAARAALAAFLLASSVAVVRPGEGPARLRFRVDNLRRGVHRLGGVHVTALAPGGIVWARAHVPGATTLEVLPRAARTPPIPGPPPDGALAG